MEESAVEELAVEEETAVEELAVFMEEEALSPPKQPVMSSAVIKTAVKATLHFFNMVLSPLL